MSHEVHAWIDVTAGVAGDMLLGALVDAGAPLAGVQAALDELLPGQVRLHAEEQTRGGQRGTKIHVEVLVDDQPHRTWRSIRELIASSSLDEQTKERSLAAFGRLAEAEARVHGTTAQEVHFHEVGALDSIADVVGTCEALRLLGVTTLSASPLALGQGRVRAAHGDIPVPVPAVAELVLGWQVLRTGYRGELAGGAPGGRHSHSHGPHDEPAEVTVAGAVGELATPTGVALVRALACACEELPAMTPRAIGIGCGGKDFADHPNVVRVILGTPAMPDAARRGTLHADPQGLSLAELAANVDDLDPRLWPGVLAALLDAGARDAWLVPITMKKGRPAHTVHALATTALADRVGRVLLEHTSTLGYRQHLVERTVLARSWHTVDVLGEAVQVKVGALDGRILHAAAEFDSLAAAAARLGRSEQEVNQHLQAALGAAGLLPGAEEGAPR